MDVHSELQTLISTDTGRNDVGDTSANKGQCVGLVESWIDVFGYPHIWGNAKDLLANADPNFYEVILNTPNNFPEEGDIIVWDETWGGGDGHCAIAVAGADTNQFSSFEQNDHTPQDPSGVCEILKHIYVDSNNKGVKGWIRFKNLSANAPINYHGLDPKDPKSTQIVYDTWWDKANGQLVDLAKYQLLQTEFDEYKKQYPAASPSPSEDQAHYTEMRVAGYTTLADVTKALEGKESTITELKQDQVILEQKNEKLADTLALDSKNNYTAMQEGNNAVDKAKELQDNLDTIMKATGADKANFSTILNKILIFRDVYNKFVEKLDKEQATKEEAQFAEQAIKDMEKTDVKTDVNWLMNIFNFKKGVSK